MDFYTFLQSHPVILLFIIIAFGFLLGRIRFFSFTLESSGILFVAMLFGHFGLTLPKEFQMLGLIFFIYAVGLQAGPTILNISKKQSLRNYGLVLIVLSSGAIVTFLAAKIFSIETPMAIGLFAGAMTSTPGLAAAQETTQSTLTSSGYGLAYPFGVIGVILFIKLLPVMLKTTVKACEQQEEKQKSEAIDEVITAQVRITNPALQGKNLQQLHFNQTTGTIISRILHEGQLIIPSAGSRLQLGDIVRLIGTKSHLEAAVPFLGEISSDPLPDVEYFESRRFVVTNKEVVGKSVAELNLRAFYNANITRIRRGGVEFTARPEHKLNWGDRVRVAGDASQMDQIRQLLGDEMRKIEHGDIFAIVLGILLGIFAGLIPFSIGRAIAFNLGITGGVLLAGLILSNRGKVGPVIWQVPLPIITFMRELGLILFLAVIGIDAGSDIVHTLMTNGYRYILAGAMITLLPMIITAFVARRYYRLNLLELIGLISGGMTSTPGLASGTAVTESQTPVVMYATVYPFAMILMMVWVKILALF